MSELDDLAAADEEEVVEPVLDFIMELLMLPLPPPPLLLFKPPPPPSLGLDGALHCEQFHTSLKKITGYYYVSMARKIEF